MKKRRSGFIKKKFTALFHERTPESIAFNRLLIALNIAVFCIFILEYYYPGQEIVRMFELFFGVLFTIEYALRFWIAPKKTVFVFDIFSIVDFVVIVSLFAPLLVGNLALLRVLRSLKILRTYYIVDLMKNESNTVARYKATILSLLNFFVFLAIMTAIVFVAESQFNPHINSYIDALYFTVSTLTTTGYGDVTAVGPWGKLLSVTTMLVGITLFLQLTRTIFYGSKKHYICSHCGLSSHDVDATHCKHCGKIIKHKHSSYIV